MPPKLPTERPPVYTPAPKVAWILSAKRAELQYEIQLINDAAINNGANKAPYNKQGRIDDLREKLAWHHGLNLHPIGTGEGADVNDDNDDPDFKSVDEVVAGQIIDAQWEGLMALGEEWKKSEELEGRFMLWNDEANRKVIVNHPIAASGSTTPGFAATTQQQTPQPFPGGAVHASMPAPSPLAAPTTAESTPHTSSASRNAILLTKISKPVKSLQHARTLHEAIEQHKTGAVGQQRAFSREAADWPARKNTISRRNRLYSVLEVDFKGDEDRFFDFFSLDPKKVMSLKQKHPNLPDKMHVACNTLTDKLMPACNTAIEAEQKKDEYHVDGEFSQQVWEERWGDKNRWEIFKELDTTLAKVLGEISADEEQGA